MKYDPKSTHLEVVPLVTGNQGGRESGSRNDRTIEHFRNSENLNKNAARTTE